MSMSHVRQLSDGEELIVADQREALLERADPRAASVERRSRALSDARPADPSLRAGSPSSSPTAAE